MRVQTFNTGKGKIQEVDFLKRTKDENSIFAFKLIETGALVP